MANNEVPVSVVVTVVTKGQDQLAEIDKKLDKLNVTQTKSIVAKTKDATETSKLTTSLSKQIPALREIQPILSAVGLGWLTGASAIGLLGAGAMQAYQAFQTYQMGLLGLNIIQNTLAGGTTGFDAVLADAQKNADKLGISVADFSKEMGKLEGVVHNPVTALQMMNDAVSISHATGIPLDQVVNALSSAFQNGVWKDGAFIQPGILALQTMEAQLRTTGDATLGLNITVTDQFNNMWEKVKIGIGDAINSVKIGWEEMIMSNDTSTNIIGGISGLFGPVGLILASITEFKGGIKNLGIWDGIGAAWSSFWQGATGFPNIKKGWDGMVAYLGNVNWDGLWNGLGTAWSRIWRGAINLAIINPINGLINLLDLIHVDIPSWVPIFGGKVFGINITPIPQLASGGNLLSGGNVIVGERGPEMLSLPGGASVSPLNNSGGLGGPITIPIYIGNELLTTYVVRGLDDIVRLRGGF